MPSTAIPGILSGFNYMVMISCCPRYKRLGNNTYSSFNDVSSDDWGEQTRQVGQAVGERHKDSSETRGDVQVVNLYKNIGKNLDTGEIEAEVAASIEGVYLMKPSPDYCW